MAAGAITAAKSYVTISHLARRHGVSLRTLRFYEDRGLLNPLRQGQSRLYTPMDERRLQLIIKGKRFGFSLNCIAELLTDHAAKGARDDRLEITEMMGKSALQEQIAALQAQRARIEEAILELERSLQALGAAKECA